MAEYRFLPGYGVVEEQDGDPPILAGYGVLNETVVTPAPVVDAGGWKPLGGDVSHWLEPLPPEVREIIEEVAEEQAKKEAVKEEPKNAPIAPLKTAIRRADFTYKPDYAAAYRQAYEAALARIRKEIEDDDEEALMVLL